MSIGVVSRARSLSESAFSSGAAEWPIHPDFPRPASRQTSNTSARYFSRRALTICQIES